MAIGENLLFVNDVTFAAGDVYQDILQRPDGTLYYASHIDLAAFDSQLTKNLSNIVFTVNGVAIPFTTGSTPSPTGFVLATDTSVAGKTTLVMYFPGDAAAMIANPSGAGALSYTVPAGGQTFRLGFTASVPDVPALTAGKVLDGSECFASVSTGPSNRDTARTVVKVAVAEPSWQRVGRPR